MKLRIIKGIILKDLKELRREKMALFWIFIFPLMWITLFGTIWGGESPPITVDIGVFYTNESAPFTAYDIVEIMRNVTLEETNLFNVLDFKDENSALEVLKSGKIDAVVVFPKEFGTNLTSGRQAKVYLYFDKSDPQDYQIVSGVVKGFFGEMEKEMKRRNLEMQLEYMESYLPKEIIAEYNLTTEMIRKYMLASAEPIVIEEKEVESKTATPIQFYVTSFIGIQLLFATMLTVGSGTLEEIQKGTLRRIVASPATAWDFLMGKMLSTFLVIMFSIVVGLGYAKLLFGETIIPSLLGWVIIFIDSLFSMSLGLAIAMGTRSIKSTTAVVNFVSMPLLFLAGIVVPESVLPKWVRPIANYFPLGRALKDFRLLEIYKRSASEIAPDILWLSLATLITLIIALVLYNWAVKRIEV